MNNDTNVIKSASEVADVHLVADLPGLREGLGELIALGAPMSKEDFEAMIKASILAKFAPEVERVQVLCAELKVKLVSAQTRLQQLKARMAETVRRVSVADPPSAMPKGLERLGFGLCIVLAVVVTIGDGINAALLAARVLQSLLAGLAFLLPSLCAPVLAKLAVTRLPSRSRFWAELFLGLGGFATAGFFVYQFVATFTAQPTLDQIAAGGGVPNMQYVYLATLTLGFLVVYFLISKAISMVRPGPTEQENPEYVTISAEVSTVEQEIAKLQGEMDAQQPRMKKIDVYVDHLTKISVAAVEAKRNLLSARTESREARAEARMAAAERDWTHYGALLGERSRPVNGEVQNEMLK